MKKRNVISLVGIYLTLFTNSIFALVDYSDDSLSTSSSTHSSKSAKRIRSKKKIKTAKGHSKSYSMKGMFSLKPYYESTSVETIDHSGKIGKIGVSATMKPSSVFSLHADYWRASSADTDLSEDDSMQAGNPLFKIGFNWFRMGSAQNLLSVDLYGAITLGSKSSDFASSRTDQIIGLQTAKKINDFLIMLEGSYRMTGNPKNEQELDIGGIRTLSAGIGLYLTNDIRFSLIASAYKINESSNSSRGNYLEEKVSFSTISPKLYLQISPQMNLELGGVFRTQREKSKQDLVSARLFNTPGIYGSGLHAGLNISL